TQRRLMSDVPLGVFLSGGIDSSLVAALASRHVPAGALRTFSIGFTEASFDELGWANQVANLLRTSHQTEVLDLDRALEVLPQIFDKLDEPQGDSSLLPTWLLSRFTRRHVTVALGGDGGDELFAGYDPFLALRKADSYAKLVPKPLHLAIRLLASHLPVSHANVSLDFKIKRTLRGLSHPPALWNPVWLGALEENEIADFLGKPEDLYSEAIEAWDSCPQRNVVDRTLQFYTKIYLQDGILAKVDRASMMNSLEARAPFLDIEVANFARRLPHEYKLRGGTTKYLLKKAAARVLPAEIIHRKKKGFGSPIGPWFRSGRIAPASPDAFVQNRIAAHRAGRSDERLFLWCQFVFEEWKKRRLP
ncbi:MAG: asparagine synthetase B family protein, partial [Chthoniobacterales bacterium]